MIKNVYFIGIGGIGMSAIARYYKKAGKEVSGYDRTPTDLTQALENEGISVHYTDSPELLPTDIENSLIIYTPAIPPALQELSMAKSKGYTLIKRSKALGIIAKGQKCLAISGSHGKTTTSTLLAHIYTDSGVGCNAFLGGISKNYNTNLLLGNNNVLVAEADEFDRSFLQLYPHMAVVTATDPDHLDIYGSVEKMREAYAEFAGQTDTEGFVIVKKGAKLDTSKIKATLLSYAFSEKSDFYASDIKPLLCQGVETGHFSFTLNYPKFINEKGKIENCTVGVPGWVNIENAVAASAIALLDGVPPLKIKQALSTFKGVRRRFDIHLNTPHLTYIDDYAHHPNEIKTTISSLREAFPGRRLTGIFQPHLYTRTRDLYKEFAEALSALDELILLDIYPARELPIEGITSKIIFDRVTLGAKTLITKEELMPLLEKKTDIDLLVTFGAGNIDKFIEPITSLLKTRIK